MYELRIGGLYHAAAENLDVRTEQENTYGFMYISNVVPKGLRVSALENTSLTFPVTRGAKIPLATKLGYRFYWPKTYHGAVSTTIYATNATFNNTTDTSYLDGSLHIMCFSNCQEYHDYHPGNLKEVELTVEHTTQYTAGAVVTTSWGFVGLDYESVGVTCRNAADDYTIPYYLQAQGNGSDQHNAQTLGYLTACHLVDSVTYSQSGYLSLTDVPDLRIYIIPDFVYLLDQSTENTYFYYRFKNRQQQRRVVGMSVLKGYSTWTTSKNVDVPAPLYSYGFYQCYNISGVLATNTAIDRYTTVQYNNNLQVNSAPSQILANASLGGGISRTQAGGTNTQADVMRFAGTSAGTVTLLWTARLQHEYI